MRRGSNGPPSRDVGLLAIAVTLLVVGGGPTTLADAERPAAAAEAETEFDLVLDDSSFAPDEIAAPAETRLTFNFVNEGAAPHDLVIEGVDGSDLLISGASTTFEWTVSRLGPTA